MSNWYLYIAECSDRSFYIGISNDVENRIIRHNQGKGAAYTKTRRPIRLVYTESLDTHSDALKREAQLKKWSRSKKINLIKYGRPNTVAR